MPQKRKIALFSTSFLAYSQTFIYDELMAHSIDYEITVFCKNRMNEDKFPYKNFISPSGKISTFLYENIGYWPAFNKVFKSENFDLIHAHFGTGAVYALPYARKFNLPFLVTFHGNDVASAFGPRKYFPTQWRYNLLIKKIIAEMSLGLVVSKELIELLKDLGCDENKLRHFRLGIDTSKFVPSGKTKKKPLQFLMIGRFTEKKGYIYALRAFNKIIQQGKTAQLKLIGDGDFLNSCKEFVQNNALSSCVIFAGVLNSEEVAQELNNSHILLAPSVVASDFDREGLPTVIKEAMACEVPVISTYHAGIPEIITDSEDGFLVPERSIDLLAEKMIQFIENPELVKEFGTRARIKVSNIFDINKEIMLLEKHYEEVLAK